MAVMMTGDTLCGHEARAYLTVDGQVKPMFYAKALRATITKRKAELRTLGRRGTLHRTVGFSGSGQMTLFYATSLFRRLMLDYIKTGRDISFDLQVVNEDAASSLGRQTVVLRGVNLDSVVMAAFDAQSDVLEESVSFTFDDVDIIEQFVDGE